MTSALKEPRRRIWRTGSRCAARFGRATRSTNCAQALELLARGEGAATFLARSGAGAPIGFAEATLRRDYVNGCSTSPVAFLEGLYVAPAWRRRGVARLLCAAAEDWGRMLGCVELGSDTYLENIESQRMHQALGFEEMERIVGYRKII